MAKVSPLLMFQGQAEEAIRLYTSAIPKSKIKKLLKYGPDQGEYEGKVLTSLISLQGQEFVCMDSNMKHDFNFTPSFSIAITCDKIKEVDTITEKLSVNGQFLMPLDEYPFSKRFCWFVDQFGVSWQITFV